MPWTGEITYVLDTPVPSCDKDARVVYTHTDGREQINNYSLSTERFPDTDAIDAFVQAEVDRLEAEDIAAAEAAAAQVSDGNVY